MLLALVLIAGLAAALLKLLLDERRASLDEAQRLRLEALASGTAAVLATWLEGLAALGRPITGSDLVRLFASEMAARPPGLPMPRWLADQLPYMNQVIADFTARHGLLGTAIVGPDGRSFVASVDAPLLDRRIAGSWATVASDVGRAFGRVRAVTEPKGAPTLALDVFLPVSAPQLGEAAEGQDVATLVMTVPVSARLGELLAVRAGAADRVRPRLIQHGPAGPTEIVPGAAGGKLLPLEPDFPVRPGDAYTYGPIDLAADEPRLVGVGAPVAELPWTVLQQVDLGAEQRPLHGYEQKAGGIAGASGLLLLLAFAALWWREMARYRHFGVAQAADLLARLRARDRLFQSLADATEAPLSVTSPGGRYAYVNGAFAEAFGRAPAAVLGQDHAALFPPAVAAALVQGDGRAYEGALPARQLIETEVAGRRVELSIAKRALRDEVGRVIGIISVLRRHQPRPGPGSLPDDAARTADLLERVIELANPEIAARARRLAGYAVAVAPRLRLADEEAAMLVHAARLWPLGRSLTVDGTPRPLPSHGVLVPRAGRREAPWNGEAVACGRPEGVIELLQACGIDRSVAELVGWTEARLDGGDTPTGPKTARLERLARMLATLDAFCARTVEGGPEAERATPGQALYWLVRQGARFDLRVISALVDVAAAECGDADRAPAAGSAPVPLSGRREPARVDRAA